MSEDFLKNPARAVRRARQDRDRHRRVRRVWRGCGKDAGRRRRQCRARGQQCRRAEKGRRCLHSAWRQGRNRRQAAELGSQLRRHRQSGGRPLRPRRYPRRRLRPQQGFEDRRSEGRRLSRHHRRQRHAVLADGARRRPADDQARRRRQDHPDVVGARPARPSGRLHRLLRFEIGGRRHHQGARLRIGARPASP